MRLSCKGDLRILEQAEHTKPDPAQRCWRTPAHSPRARRGRNGREQDGADDVWPVALAGSGFKRLLSLLCQVSGATGLVCVDDPDAHMHPRLFHHVATVLWKLVDDGAQVMIATHSVDLVAAIADPINGPPRSEKLGVYGLTRDSAGTVSCTVRQKGAAAQLPRSRDDLRALLGF